ncbi:MAG: c-type cytochrome [Porticoccaceae bacterium]|jgi:cytochrome c5
MSQIKILGTVILATIVVACSDQSGNAELTANQQALVAERIAPDGHVVMAGQAVVAAVASAARSADAIYSVSCAACHDYAVAGAPKFGDAAAWASRLEQGIETVYTNAINGIRGMPARGTCMDCSDDEIKITIDYILENSQ